MTHTMTCDEFEAALPRLMDGEIEMTPAMQAHLHGCAACSALLADLKMIQERAGALPPLDPERDLWAGISARIEAPVVPLADRAATRSRRQLTWRSASIAAAALVLVTTGITYEMTRRNADSPLPTIHYPLPTSSPLPTTHYPLPTIVGSPGTELEFAL